MAVLCQQTLRISLFATPVILLLLLVMPRFCRRYSARLRCFVWMLLTARLLIPINFHLPLWFIDASPIANLLTQIDQNAVAAALMEMLSNDSITGVVETAPSFVMHWRLVGAVWFIGAAVFFCYNIIAYQLTVKRLQRWSVAVTDPVLLKIFEEVKGRLSVFRNIELYQTGNNNPPVLVGFLHPRIYIPNKQIVAIEIENIILHELWHYKRKDLWFKLSLLLTNALHWFNPIVYFMLRQVEFDIEIACDNDVLRNAASITRRQYGLTILSFVEETTTFLSRLTTTFFGGKKQMKLRFSNIISPKQKKSGAAFILFIGLLTACCSLLADKSVFAAASAQEMEPARYLESADLPEGHGNGEMLWPVPDYYLTSAGYGKRYESKDFHMGLDISGKDIFGAPVIAAEAGTVLMVVTEHTPGMGYGKHLIIGHEGNVSTVYAQLSDILVKAGDTVEKGQVIAKVGSTGFAAEPHLHFEVREGAAAVAPVSYLMPVEELK